MRQTTRRWGTLMLLVVVVAAGCATAGSVRRAATAEAQGDLDLAVAYYREALTRDPDRVDVRISLERATRAASIAHITKARELEAQDQLPAAAAEYRLAVDFDPSNALALTKALELERKVRDLIEATRPPTRMEELQRQAAAASPIPRLDPRTPLTGMRFNNSAFRDILNTISKATGINIMYDAGLDGLLQRPYTIDVDGQTLEQVLNQVLTAAGMTFKVTDSRTIFVYQDNVPNRTKYEDLYQQTFLLSHGDVQEVANILNQMLATTQAANRPIITQNKSASAIVVRATAPMMSLIKNIIDAADKPRAEVLIDVTILEVSRTRLKDLGIDLSQYAIGLAFSPEVVPSGGGFPPPSPPPVNLGTLATSPTRFDFYATLPTSVIRLLESDQKTRLLAKPQLRGREGAQLTLNLGEDVPVPQTSFLPTATGGVPTQPQISYTYRSIGVNLSITPRVTHTDDIILENFVVDKSGLGAPIDVAGQSLPRFIRRTASVAMRLRDGESNLLAGLILKEDRELARSVPGINRIPILRSLFGNVSGSEEDTDIVMIVTPHIIRSREITAADLMPLYVGTANNLGAGGTPPLINPGAPPPPPTTGGRGGGAGGGATPPAGQQQAQQQAAAQPPRTPVVVPIQAAGTEPAAGGAQIVLTAPETSLQVGGPPYNVPVRVENISQLGSVTLTITYDPKVVKAISVSQGSFMQQGGQAPVFAPKIDEAAGRIDVAIARGPEAPGAAGTGLLAGLVLEAVGPGSTTLTVTGVAMSPTGQPIPLKLAPVTVVVK